MTDSALTDIFGPEGVLAAAIEGYTPRLAQQKLAEAVTAILRDKGVLIAEAGTGTGKTYAYLVPALLSRQTTLVSTGTKNLQDQLFHRDLPTVIAALGIPVKLALLKGRANYLCKYRMDMSGQSRGVASKELAAQIAEVRALAPRTAYGEVSEITTIPEDSAVWPHVTSTIDNCLGTECPVYNECYLVKARRKALDADLVVINHHLFFADMILKDDQLGELLPTVSVVILDEAHQLAEIAAQFFGERLGSRQLLDLVHDCDIERAIHAIDMESLKSAAQRLKQSITRMREALGDAKLKAPWQTLRHNKPLQSTISALGDDLDFLRENLAVAASRSKGLESCWERSKTLLQQFKLLTGETPNNQVHWYETFSQSFSLHFTPMNVAEEFQALVKQQERAFVLTSATLTTGDSFDHFTRQTGLNDATCAQFESPFDYGTQSLLYVPRYMPDPHANDYTTAVVNAALKVFDIVQGRTFVLFTSHYALQQAAALLADTIAYPLLVQGSMPKDKLVERFRELGNAVLLGTGGFWEGVDVRGDALSCVIIDKLPFATPADPVLQARGMAIKKQGGNPFFEDQLPAAVITLKQGAGRLIRDIHDRGVLMICDPRFLGREYGKVFLASLPKMPRTRQLERVHDFFVRNDETTSG